MGTIGQTFEDPAAGADPFGAYSKGVTCSSAVVLLLAIATIDKLTGSALHVHMLYIIPVGIITWAAGRTWGLITVAGSMGISVATFYTQRLYSEEYLYYWEAAIGLVTLGVVVVVLDRLHQALAAAQDRKA